jgi:hypothetical protein
VGKGLQTFGESTASVLKILDVDLLNKDEFTTKYLPMAKALTNRLADAANKAKSKSPGREDSPPIPHIEEIIDKTEKAESKAEKAPLTHAQSSMLFDAAGLRLDILDVSTAVIEKFAEANTSIEQTDVAGVTLEDLRDSMLGFISACASSGRVLVEAGRSEEFNDRFLPRTDSVRGRMKDLDKRLRQRKRNLEDAEAAPPTMNATGIETKEEALADLSKELGSTC